MTALHGAPWYVGVEGGGTRTSAAIATAEGTVIGIGTSGPANFLSVPPRTALASTRTAVAAARAQAGSRRRRFAGVAVCVAGVGLVRDTAVITRLTRAVAGDVVVAASDTDAAWAAAFPFGGPGIIAIAGTGSVAVAKDASGARHQVGGWGYLIGDEGSGYWIGRAALAAITHAADGTGRPVGFRSAVLHWLGAAAVNDLRDLLYARPGDRRLIASAAQPVLDAAERGDPAALGIVAAAADELAHAVVAASAHLPGAGPLPVALYGGLFARAGQRTRFAASLARLAPRLEITPDPMPALAGAVLLAMDAAAVPRDRAVIERLGTTIAGRLTAV